ncbi:MAG: hypothetical protein IKX39_07515 [Muribaculaceae bacterium]|nr:hypothetical protein [Muribaculaceae bacterium]
MDKTDKSYKSPPIEPAEVMEPSAGYGTVELKNSVLSLVAAIDDTSVLRHIWDYLRNVLANKKSLLNVNDLDCFHGEWGSDMPVEEYARQLREMNTDTHRDIETW